MFREIKTREKIEAINNKKRPAYLDIKPKKELSIEELNALVLEIMNQAKVEA